MRNVRKAAKRKILQKFCLMGEGYPLSVKIINCSKENKSVLNVLKHEKSIAQKNDHDPPMTSILWTLWTPSMMSHHMMHTRW